MPQNHGFFATRAAARLFLVSAIIYIAFQTLWLAVLVPRFQTITGGGTMLDMASGFSYEQARAMIEAYGAEGVRYYGVLQAADTVFPLSYGLFLALGLGIVFIRLAPSGAVARRLYLLPVIGAVFDYGENAGIRYMLNTYPGDFAAAAGMTSALGIAKFAMLGAAFTLLGLGAFVLLFRRLRNRRRP